MFKLTSIVGVPASVQSFLVKGLADAPYFGTVGYEIAARLFARGLLFGSEDNPVTSIQIAATFANAALTQVVCPAKEIPAAVTKLIASKGVLSDSSGAAVVEGDAAYIDTMVAVLKDIASVLNSEVVEVQFVDKSNKGLQKGDMTAVVASPNKKKSKKKEKAMLDAEAEVMGLEAANASDGVGPSSKKKIPVSAGNPGAEVIGNVNGTPITKLEMTCKQIRNMVSGVMKMCAPEVYAEYKSMKEKDSSLEGKRAAYVFLMTKFVEVGYTVPGL